MAAVFFYFLELSIVASIIIVAIIFLRLLFRNRISAHFHYVLWGLLLIKLCIPIEISSPLSVFQFVNKQEATNITMNQLTTNPQQQETALIPNSNVENKAEINKPTSTEQVILPDEKQSIFTGMNILVTIWLAVIVLLLCFVSATIISTKQKLKKTMYHPLVNELTMECMNELMMRRKVRVICSPYYRTPFVFGIFKPVVVIPYHLMETLNGEQLRFIFMHEFVHLKRFDYVFRQLMVMNSILHWYNPFMWVAAYYMSEDCEKSCDAVVVKHTKQDKAYASTLIDVAEFSSNHISTMSGLSFSKNHVKGRISQIMSNKIYKKSTLVIGIVIALLLAIGLLTTNKQSASKDFMDYVPHPKSTVLLHQQKIKNGTLYVYKDETGLRQMFLTNDLKVNNNSANVELKPKEGISWGMLDNQKVSIVSLAGMVTNEDIQSVVVKQGAEEKQATIVETKEGRIWFTYFGDTLDPFKTEARSSDGRVIWENPVDKLSTKAVRVLSLTKEEQTIYDIFSKDLNEKHLAKLEPISIAKLYAQAQLDKRYNVVYALYTDRKDRIQWSKEEDEKIPLQDRPTQEQILLTYANIDQGKFIQTDDTSGYIEYFRPSMGDSLEQVMAGFNMIKDEDGIWNVAFMPLQ